MPVFRWTSRLGPRARTRTLVSGTLITAASLGAATLASVAGPAQPAAAASVSCPWVPARPSPSGSASCWPG
jgi:hypothetical protein